MRKQTPGGHGSDQGFWWYKDRAAIIVGGKCIRHELFDALPYLLFYRYCLIVGG
jgi:hypothetical protein